MTPSQKKVATFALIGSLVAGVILLIVFLVAKFTDYNIPYITPLVKGSISADDSVVNPADEVTTTTTTTKTTIIDETAAAEEAAAAAEEAATANGSLQPDMPSIEDGLIASPPPSSPDPVVVVKPQPDPVDPEIETRPSESIDNLFNAKKTKVEVTAVSSDGGGKYFRVNAAAFEKMLSDNGVAPTGTWDPAGKYWKLNVYRRRGDEASGMTVILWNNKGTQRYSPATSTPQYHGRVEPHGGITFKPGDKLELDKVQTPQ